MAALGIFIGRAAADLLLFSRVWRVSSGSRGRAPRL